MTTPEPQSSAPRPSAPLLPDRIYRSPAALAGGFLLLAIAGWLGIDAIVSGEGRTPWLALAALILLVPLVVAFTLRPAVFANEERLRIRNPFRVIVLPWGQIEALRSGYSNEVFASGRKFQLWAVPVSLRARKKAARREERRGAEGAGRSGAFGGGLSGLSGSAGMRGGGRAAVPDGPVRAETDRITDELRALQEAHATSEAAQGEVTVRWAYEVVGPAVAGALLLAIVSAVG